MTSPVPPAPPAGPPSPAPAVPASAPHLAPHVTEIDGVTAVWVDAPGPFVGGLLLRVGFADEKVPMTGITHLMEHLAFFGIGSPGEHANGEVHQTETIFFREGEPEEVVSFLDRITRQLADPPLERLAAERDVLRAEEAAQEGNALAGVLAWRYGAATYGLHGAPQYGIDTVGEAELAAWSRRFAVRQNAVLWLSKPPPAGLRLHLPDGAWQAPPDPRRTILPELPAWFAHPCDALVLHAIHEQGPEFSALEHVIGTRLFESLRTQRGIAYSPATDREPLTAGHEQLVVASDFAPGRQAEAAEGFLGAFRAVAAGAVRRQDLTDWLAARERERDDPHSGAGVAVTCARDLLFRRDLETPEQWDADCAAVTPDDVVDAAQEVLRSAVLALPEGSVAPADWAEAPSSVHPPLEILPDHRFRHADAPATEDTISVDAVGVMLHVAEPDLRITVPVAHAVGVLRWPDGRRVLIGDDGVHLDVEPTLWVEGEELVRQIDERFPAGLVIQRPARPATEIPYPEGAPAAPGLWYRFGPQVLLGLLVVAFGALVQLFMIMHWWWLVLMAFVVFGVAATRLNRVLKQRRHLLALRARRT